MMYHLYKSTLSIPLGVFMTWEYQEKKMHGSDSKKKFKHTWEEYKEWQSWNEWPERSNNPPLTVETPFWYQGKEYMVTSLRYEYVIVTQPEFKEVICNKNFIDLLNMPFIDGKSFKKLINEFLFED